MPGATTIRSNRAILRFWLRRSRVAIGPPESVIPPDLPSSPQTLRPGPSDYRYREAPFPLPCLLGPTALHSELQGVSPSPPGIHHPSTTATHRYGPRLGIHYYGRMRVARQLWHTEA